MVKHKNKEKARLKTNTQQHPVKLRDRDNKVYIGSANAFSNIWREKKRNGMEWNKIE
jgi:hypothetical protein